MIKHLLQQHGISQAAIARQLKLSRSMVVSVCNHPPRTDGERAAHAAIQSVLESRGAVPRKMAGARANAPRPKGAGRMAFEYEDARTVDLIKQHFPKRFAQLVGTCTTSMRWMSAPAPARRKSRHWLHITPPPVCAIWSTRRWTCFHHSSAGNPFPRLLVTSPRPCGP